MNIAFTPLADAARDDKMQAAVFSAAGSLQVPSEAKLPTPGPEQCLVRVAASGLNPTDWKHMSQGTQYYSNSKATPAKPVGLGCEGSGVIEQAPQGSGFQTGDRVWFMVDKMASPPECGSCAEYVCLHTKTVAKAPEQMSMDQAAGTPLALLTAFQSMRAAGFAEEGCGKGKSILVHAGAGGVGHFALQLARIYGFDRIVSTCSSGNAEFVRSLGATASVDYRSEDFVALYKADPFDVVVDPVGGEPVGCCCAAHNDLAAYMPRSRRVTKKSGWAVGILTGTTLMKAPCGMCGAICCSLLPGLCAYKCCGACGCAPRYAGPYFLPSGGNMATAGSDLAKLAAWVDRGLIRTHVGATFDLKEISQALAELEGKGHNPSNAARQSAKPAQGKIVVKVP